MTTDIHSEQPAQPHRPAERTALLAMLEARSVAIVGASKRADSFGERMLAEAQKSPAKPVIYPVNPRYPEIGGLPCYPTLADLPEQVDLALLGVPDGVLEEQLTLAAAHGCRAAVIFGNAHEDPASDAEPVRPRANLRQRLAAIARSSGMELCGAGCMGFANVSHGLRVMGYVEPDPLPAGPVALVTHSGSVFSTMLRSRRAFGYTLAVSSGQELVTAAPSYLSYALNLPDTKVIGLILEAMRQPDELRKVLTRATERDLPVVLLTAGNSASGRAMVAAHSGALAGSDGGWEALVRYYGIHRVSDLAEMADALELFALRATRRGGRSPAVGGAGHGIATVHDSGLERAHTADVADEVGVPFAAISDATKGKLEALLDPGLLATNPLDVWGTGAGTREVFAGSLTALAEDESVDAVALAVDLITELDGDTAYQLAALDTAGQTNKPVVVLSNMPGAIDPEAAVLLRSSGIPVLEGMRSGLRALRHLLDHAARPSWHEPARPMLDQRRRDRARMLLNQGRETGAAQLDLLGEYGIRAARA
ncbi:MAG: CoA-binding protein, partial [Nocardiopsaceae bacterium]|nr:CoA-binding protein [Nocardiopsaceae bacterium]